MSNLHYLYRHFGVSQRELIKFFYYLEKCCSEVCITFKRKVETQKKDYTVAQFRMTPLSSLTQRKSIVIQY